MGAGVLFISKGSVLLLQRNKNLSGNKWGGFWNLPGGTTDKGESHYQTAIRESQEEIGSPPQGTYFFDHYSSPAYSVFFADCPFKFKPILNEEHSAYAWVPVEQINRYKLHPREKNPLMYFCKRFQKS